MIWPPQNTGIFEFKLPCCDCTPEVTCPFPIYIRGTALLFGGTPFASEGDAQTELDDPQAVAACVAYSYYNIGSPGTPFDTFTAIDGGTDITISASRLGAGDNAQLLFACSVNIEAGANLLVDYSLVTTGGSSPKGDILVALYDCDGTFITQQSVLPQASSMIGTLTFPITDAGGYLVVIQCTGFTSAFPFVPPTSVVADFTVYSDDIFSVNPVAAIWDDGGTPTPLFCE